MDRMSKASRKGKAADGGASIVGAVEIPSMWLCGFMQAFRSGNPAASYMDSIRAAIAQWQEQGRLAALYAEGK